MARGGRSTGPEPSSFALPFANISAAFGEEAVIDGFAAGPVCVRDLYKHDAMGPIDPQTSTLDAALKPHDSAFYCVYAATEGRCGASKGCPAYAA